jgi:hypothetical protein
MNKSAIVSLTLTVLLFGCSTTKQLSTVSQLNRSIGDNPALIKLKSGEEFHAREVNVDTDSTRFLTGDPDSAVVIPSSDVGSVKITHHGGGALEGLVFGTFGGGVFGVTAYVTHDEGLGMIGMLLIPLGGIGGAVYGGITGHDYTYIFPTDSLEAKPPMLQKAVTDSTR